jgi:F0F1-type ATP synthase gamma subunit
MNINWRIEMDASYVDEDYVEAVVESLMNGDTLQSWLNECHADTTSMDSTAGNAAMILYGYQVYLKRVAQEWGEIGPETQPPNSVD